jgi:Cu(I)/Ag(I) efflux system membrane protein CusA/SilA
MMTVTAAIAGLLPIMWSVGTGADVMKRVAAPMVGGLMTSFVLEFFVYPPLYLLWKWHTEVGERDGERVSEDDALGVTGG